jgi:muconate cycloisomerase
VKIARIETFKIKMPLKGVIVLPKGASRTLDEGKRVVLVKIIADDGTVGWGESGPSRRWSAETLESCESAIRDYLAPAVIGHDAFDVAGLHERMNTELAPGLDPGQPIAKNAIDVACHDMICRKLGINLQSWLGAKRQDHVRLARLVSAASAAEAERITRDGLAEGYQGFKVKVGHDPRSDVDIVRAVKQVAGDDAVVWADANQGYTLEQARYACREFEKLGLTLFEQPVPMSNVYAMKKLLSATSMTIALDEATISIPFAIELIRREAIEGMAIKINKAGGIYYARQLCDLALNAGLTLIGSGLMDAPIGFAASVHLYSAYGISLPVDLNGPQFIAEDYLGKPFPIERTVAKVPTGPGLGIDIDESKVARFARDLATTDRAA